MSLNSLKKMLLAGGKPTTGQVEWTTPGTRFWTVPAGVFFISVVCVGAGGGGSTATNAGGGGGGGGLAWQNIIPVTPGQQFTVVVGQGGAGNGGLSRFGDLVEASGGAVGGGVIGGAGGSLVKGEGGGSGGAGGNRTSTTTNVPADYDWEAYRYSSTSTSDVWAISTSTPANSYINYAGNTVIRDSNVANGSLIHNQSGDGLYYQRGSFGRSSGGVNYYQYRRGTQTKAATTETTYFGGGGGGAGGYEADGGVGGRGLGAGGTSTSRGRGGSNGANGQGISLRGFGGASPLVGAGAGAGGNGQHGGVRIIFPGKDRFFPSTRLADE